MVAKVLLQEPVIHLNPADPPVSGAATMLKLTDGNILLAWLTTELDFGTGGGSTHNYHAQIYAPDGTPVGARFLINDQVIGFQYDLRLTALSGGGFAAAWSTEGTGGASNNFVDVHARVFANDGTPLANEFLANSGVVGTQAAVGLVSTATGGFAVVYQDLGVGAGSATGLRLQAFTSAGLAVGNDVVLQQQSGNVIALDGGNLLVTWSETLNGALDVRARIFDGAGTALTAPFTVNQSTPGFQGAPNAALLSDGRFVVVWGDSTNGAVDVEARIFNANGSPAGGEFTVNTITDGIQGNPVVTALGDGGFVVSWLDYAASFTPLGDLLYYLSGQRFDAAGGKVGDQFGFEVPTNFIQGHALTTLDDGRVAITWAPALFEIAPNGVGTLTDASAYLRFIDFTDANAAPIIAWQGGGAVANIQFAEDTPFDFSTFDHRFGRVTASDPNGDRLTYTLSGEDAALFSLDPVSGKLILNQRVNFENPSDAGRDNVYHVTIVVSDGAASDSQDLVLTVTDVVDGVTLVGTARNNALTGGEREDSLSGLGGNDTLLGLNGDDSLDGGSGNDTLNGGFGADLLTGGLGRDTFVFNDIGDSFDGLFDTITDFSHGQGDRISLGAIDANVNRDRDQGFTFIGTKEFSGVAGQLRYYHDGGDTFVSGDVNGDGIGDFLIGIAGEQILVPNDFFL